MLFRSNYEDYLYYINKEIEDGERARAPTRSGQKKSKVVAAPTTNSGLDEKQLRKELKNIERTIKTLDARRTELNEQLMQTTDANEALRLHNEFKAVEMDLGLAEERWLELNSFE